MQPLGFVNWRTVNRYFVTVMWVVVVVLALVVFTHLVHGGAASHATAGAVYMR